MNLGEQLGRGARRLAAAGVEAPRQQARWLLAHVLDIDPSTLFARWHQTLSAEAAERYGELIDARCRHRPLQHLLGTWPFLDFELRCDERALVPRPETEDLVLAVSELVGDEPLNRVIDVGTGGGCIALALARRHPALEVLALDADRDALALARENAESLGVAGRIGLLRSDLLESLAPLGAATVVVANLPYVTAEEWETLEPEVRDHEPRRALVAGEGGLALIRRLMRQAAGRLSPGGWLALEMAPGQTASIAAELGNAGWESCRVARDRFDRPRIVTARWRGPAAHPDRRLRRGAIP